VIYAVTVKDSSNVNIAQKFYVKFIQQEKKTALYNYLTSEPSKPSEPVRPSEPSEPTELNQWGLPLPLKLTKRQKLLASLLSIGLSNQQIAEQMECSRSTIQNTVNLMCKNARIGSQYNKRARLIFLYNETIRITQMPKM